MVVLSAVTVVYPAGYRRFAEQFQTVEDTVKASGLRRTILRCADFASNGLEWASQIRPADGVRGAYGDAATSTIDERDIAAVAVRALLNPAHAGNSYLLTGPQSLTQHDKVRLIGQAIGRDLSFVELPPSRSARRCSPVAIPTKSPTGCSAPWPTTPSSPDRPQPPWSRSWLAPARTFAEWAADHVAASWN